MKNRFQEILRGFAEAALRTQHYRHFRAHVWDDAVRELNSESCK